MSTNSRGHIIKIVEEHIDNVIEVLKDPNIDLNVKGCIALYYACRKGLTDSVKTLLERPEIQVNIQDEKGMTSLHYACKEGFTDIVKLLLSHPTILVNIKCKRFGETPFYYACSWGHIDIVETLLARPGIDVNIKDKSGSTPLHHLLDIDIVKALLASGRIDVNSQDEDGNTPLHNACQTGCTNIVKTLLERPEIQVNIQNKDGVTPLQKFFGFAYSFGYGYTDHPIVKSFLEHPDFDPTIQDEDGKTILDLFSDEDEFIEIATLLKNFIKEKEQQTTEDFCLAMIQPTIPVSTMTKKRKAKELRRDELRLPSEITKLIATYLDWKDISKKSCFEVAHLKEAKEKHQKKKI